MRKADVQTFCGRQSVRKGGTLAENAQQMQVIDLGRERARRGLSSDPYVSKKEAAAHFGVSTRTLERWVHAGCPALRLYGGPYRFQLAVIAAWHEEQAGRKTLKGER